MKMCWGYPFFTFQNIGFVSKANHIVVNSIIIFYTWYCLRIK